MDARNNLTPPTTVTPRRRKARRHALDAETEQQSLIRMLRRLYRAERLLARELRQLFQASTSLPFRLVLADQRRATDRHILRLERIIQTKTGAPASRSVAARGPTRPLPGPLDRETRRTAPTREMMAFPLMAAQAGVVAYQSAIVQARKLGEIWIMGLLTESLNESLAMAIALEDQATLL